MNFCMAGIDYRSAPLALRERVFLSRDRAAQLVQGVMARQEAEGIFVLSTCARTEIYAQGSSEDALRALFASLGNAQRFVQFRPGQDAAAHIFAVAAGVDSPVFGDADVVRQIKDAYFGAREQGTLTTTLSRILERALCVSREIRSTLHLVQRDSNVAVRAVKRALVDHGPLAGKVVDVIGCGVIGQSLIAELCRRQARVRIVANRRYDRAALVAQEQGCQVVRFVDFYDGLSTADMVFSATASPHRVVRADLFKRAVPFGKKVVIFDLAVPRDVDEQIAKFPGVELYTVDDIGAPAAAALVLQARHIAQRKADEFWARENIYAD